MKRNYDKKNLSDEDLANVSGGSETSSQDGCVGLTKEVCYDSPYCTWKKAERYCDRATLITGASDSTTIIK